MCGQHYLIATICVVCVRSSLFVGTICAYVLWEITVVRSADFKIEPLPACAMVGDGGQLLLLIHRVVCHMNKSSSLHITLFCIPAVLMGLPAHTSLTAALDPMYILYITLFP